MLTPCAPGLLRRRLLASRRVTLVAPWTWCDTRVVATLLTPVSRPTEAGLGPGVCSRGPVLAQRHKWSTKNAAVRTAGHVGMTEHPLTTNAPACRLDWHLWQFATALLPVGGEPNDSRGRLTSPYMRVYVYQPPMASLCTLGPSKRSKRWAEATATTPSVS